MPSSFNSTPNQITQINEDLPGDYSGYVTDTIINDPEVSFTPAEITLNPKIFNQVDEYDEITIENVVVAKNKLIDTLTKTNKNLINIIVNYSKETIDINNYIEGLSKKINDASTVIDLTKQLEEERNEHGYLKIGYTYLTQEYLTLKKTYNGLNRVYIENIINYFTVDDKQKIAILKKENDNLKGLFLCRICFTNTINIILNPCGHVAICKMCMERIIDHTNGSSAQCPLCNNNIERYDNIFIPI